MFPERLTDGYRTFVEYMFTRVVPSVTEAFREP